MAIEKIALGINLRQCKNTKNKGFGKYYPEVDQMKTLSLRGFVDHMTSHGCPYHDSIITSVLNQVTEHMTELVAQGVPVQLPMGTFYPTAEVAEDGAVASIADMEGLNPNDIVKGIHIRFLPDGSKLDSLLSPTFKERCSLELRNIVDTTEVTLNGKARKLQTLKPIATAVAELKGNGTGSGGANEQGQNQGDGDGNDETDPVENRP